MKIEFRVPILPNLSVALHNLHQDDITTERRRPVVSVHLHAPGHGCRLVALYGPRRARVVMPVIDSVVSVVETALACYRATQSRVS